MAETRLCTAQQFFQDEEEAAAEGVSTNDRVVDLLNQASLLQRDNQRINNLKLVQELIVHKEPALLDNFLDEMLAFQTDRSVDVKKFVVGFIDEASKCDPEVLPKVVGTLQLLLQDENVGVVKKVILGMTQIYKVAVKWLAKAKKVTDEMSSTWAHICSIKAAIIEMIDSENDGIRTHAVKFLENVAIVLSRRTLESDVPKLYVNDITLDQIPEQQSFLDVEKLEEEGKKALDGLLDFQGSPHISSVNLMTVMGALTNIAKQRPQYMARVVAAYEALHVNLPPTLAKSQVSSVRKNLKMQMLSLLKHYSAVDFHPQITTLLTDLGATQQEVLRAMPKIDETRKRKMEESSQASKKQKLTPGALLDKEDDDYPMAGPSISLGKGSIEDQKQTAIDITADDLVSRLSPQNVADLVLLSMVMLPDQMPAQFQSTYTPIAAAGTQAQIKHLSRLLATQLTAAGLGKGYTELQLKAKLSTEPEDKEVPPKQAISTVVGGVEEAKSHGFTGQLLPPPPAPVPQVSRKGIKAFKLSSVTQPLDPVTMDKMALEAFKRILKAEKAAILGNAVAIRNKILIGLVSQYGGMLKDELQEFIFADLRDRADLALGWIYQEYANYKGYNLTAFKMEKPTIASYDECLTRLLTGLLERPDQKEGMFSRLLLEAPSVTPNAITVLKKYCQGENRIFFGMTTLKDLIVKRPSMKLEFLDVLLDFTSHEKAEVRTSAIRVAKKLHERTDLRNPIERAALHCLKHLTQPCPPLEMFGPDKGRETQTTTWTEDLIKACLYLYLGLLPINHKLIHELASVYTATAADIKRTILRVLEAPVKGMGMQSPELLLLVENCPKGAETLVTRVIHILTDKMAPSPQLVERVRDLYQKRVSDVRFLIPVLNGLSKKEVTAVLPKLIKLNPVVVREVFNRLLGAHGQESGYTSPLTPAELLIALHNIENSKCDMKTIIRATNLCFNEKTVYTQEVLAVVMKTLMEQSPLPTLFMRTVIQSLAMYTKLIGFVMNIMQRLITKQVWKQKKVWEGFVKCCQRTKPQSYQVLLHLPAPQLKSVFEICPDLREPLLQHVQEFTPHQRAHIHKTIMLVLEKDPLEEQKAVDLAKKEEEGRLAKQEELYQQKLEEEHQRQEAQHNQKPDAIKEEEAEKVVTLSQPDIATLPAPTAMVEPLLESETIGCKQEEAEKVVTLSQPDRATLPAPTAMVEPLLESETIGCKQEADMPEMTASVQEDEEVMETDAITDNRVPPDAQMEDTETGGKLATPVKLEVADDGSGDDPSVNAKVKEEEESMETGEAEGDLSAESQGKKGRRGRGSSSKPRRRSGRTKK